MPENYASLLIYSPLWLHSRLLLLVTVESSNFLIHPEGLREMSLLLSALSSSPCFSEGAVLSHGFGRGKGKVTCDSTMSPVWAWEEGASLSVLEMYPRLSIPCWVPVCPAVGYVHSRVFLGVFVGLGKLHPLRVSGGGPRVCPAF